MESIALTILAVGAAFGAIGILWLILGLVGWARKQYRRKVYETALFIAQERPDLLNEVAEQFDLSPSQELVPMTRRPRIVSIESLTRNELEQYARTLEAVVTDARAKWLMAVNEAEMWRAKFDYAWKLRTRYWNKIKRVIAAEAQGVELFPVLHPYLARSA